jgi:phosphoribosylaminoimidazole-succinocarboxamide synthase
MRIAGFRHIYSGKVRELFEPEDENFSHLVLILATDRISAFDHILTPEIPNKGVELTAITNWWLDRIDFPNHQTAELAVPASFEARAVIAKKLKIYPVECVVRGYISGSGWREYQATGKICNIELPVGLMFGDKLPEPIFTPASKAPQGQKDENISFDEVIDSVGKNVAEALRDASITIYSLASSITEEAGLILADTKFEFGADPLTGTLTLGDEVLTPDSSRYWDRSLWEKGERDQSFDKQVVRNWLMDNWDLRGDPPSLSQEIVELTAVRYRLLREKLASVKL